MTIDEVSMLGFFYSCVNTHMYCFLFVCLYTEATSVSPGTYEPSHLHSLPLIFLI